VHDYSDRLLQVMAELEEIADNVPPQEAARDMEESTLQLFWRQWPYVSSWAGALWRLLNEDIADPAVPPRDELDEVGGSD
jgi:hypothetical protein